MDLVLYRDNEAGRQQTTACLRGGLQTAGDVSDIDLDATESKISNKLDAFCNQGSGWNVEAITRCTVHIGQYSPLAGSSFIETPQFIRDKQCVVNIVNMKDNKCFAWSVLAHIHRINKKQNPNRVSHYKPYLKELNLNDIKFPVKISQIKKFESNNPTIAINVFHFSNLTKEILPIRITQYRNRRHHINLLMLTDTKNSAKSHYVVIRDMSRLVAHRNNNRRKSFVCNFCLHPFYKKDSFERHLPDCMLHKPRKVEYPDSENYKDCTLEWRNLMKTETVPFIIYSDFESFLKPSQHEDSKSKSTYVVDVHEPSGFCCFTVSKYPKYQTEPFLYSGPDVMDHFFDHLIREERRISKILNRNIHILPLTKDEESNYDNAVVCYRCNKHFTSDNKKCKHHDHVTGQFIAALCNNCNMSCKPRKRGRFDDRELDSDDEHGLINELIDANFLPEGYSPENESQKWYLPIVFHNLRNYDAHHIFKHFQKRIVKKTLKNGKVTYDSVRVIAINSEKFISFDILGKRFIDSVQFLNASLESLVDNLCKSCVEPYDKFIHTRKYMGDNELLFGKGIFMYEYLTSIDKFKEDKLPPKEAFYSRLNDSELSDADYERAQKIWKTFNCRTIHDYHDHYLKSDTLLLADTFEHFRKVAYETYGLDPAHYLSAPGFSWDCCLKYTGVKLDP